MQNDTIALHVSSTSLDNLSKTSIKGVCEANMANNTTLEKGKRTNTLCTINDLIRNDKVHGLDVFLEGADGGKGDDASYADMSKSGNVGSVGDLVRSELVVDAVAGEEGDVNALVGEDVDG